MQITFVAGFAVLWSAIVHADSYIDQQKEVVWHWSSECGKDSHAVGLTVMLSEHKIYQSSLRVCAIPREKTAPDKQQEKLVFYYKDPALSNEGEIEGNIWDAGGEPSSIIMGLSLESKHGIFLNTIFIMDVKKEASAVVMPNLRIVTEPQ
jgi:hypothetical protein